MEQSKSQLQIQLFHNLKSKVTGNLVDEVAGILDISTDSAYRRIRGDKSLSLDEVYKLCTHYKLSLDHLLNIQGDSFVFTGNFVNPATFTYEAYLQGVVQNMKYMLTFEKRTMYYLCKDIPLFHHFHFREIAAFKHYFWMKAYIQSPEFATKKFSLSDFSDELFEKGREVLNYYNQFDSVEIWNIENINSTLRQVSFYHETGAFKHDHEVEQIYTALEQLLFRLEKQATAGVKYNFDTGTEEGKYQMYYNEVFLGDNSIFVKLNNNKVVHLVHNVFNYMKTFDVNFCGYTYDYIQNLIKKSTLISTVSERERAKFFKYLRNKIHFKKEQANT